MCYAYELSTSIWIYDSQINFTEPTMRYPLQYIPHNHIGADFTPGLP